MKEELRRSMKVEISGQRRKCGKSFSFDVEKKTSPITPIYRS
jgi:hypothetical protein